MYWAIGYLVLVVLFVMVNYRLWQWVEPQDTRNEDYYT